MGVNAGRKGLEEKARKDLQRKSEKRLHKEVRNENESGRGEAC